ncbi:TIGR03750 family conjugal transfer protein [Salmonella enterica]|uniref:TIGR03750 family conjugal transfer protein n=1 Tax=Salmonella enterica TaxID=28901 RepID=A0A5U4HAK0_SALER|nr:TIGR03750 family conjugal transfer protein [Salmonella enterica]EBV0440688.1 TIGR03750 family conjugal transfer protein [Salmonella enterica subsp. enterica serovar Brandenburg]ECU7930196.1 TIGR03750 family conjugal transfer protein [Salmonella enterica subsp. enterica serovar Goldcoast]EAX3102474.1 TIGR03750 family conjugal transfer protein [Salmonella enterica]EAX3133868.1 TIGR03750 family conjugal transfer protein [Salmonella enterica]
MATIDFIPDKLNTRPVVWRGFTVEELGLTALAGLVIGFVLAMFILPFTSWIAFPMLMILMPIPTAWLSGGWLMRYRRNKPDHYLWQRVYLLRARLLSPGEHGSLATGSYRFITLSRAWELKRTRRKGLV